MYDKDEIKGMPELDLRRVQSGQVLIIFLIVCTVGFGLLALELNSSYQELLGAYDTLYVQAKEMCPFMFPQSNEPLTFQNLAKNTGVGG